MSWSVNTAYTQNDAFFLKGIFGYEPTVDVKNEIANMKFEGGKMIVLTASFFEIKDGSQIYKICPSQFEKKINSEVFKGEGFFEGPWDEAGKKIANYYFSKHNEGSIIYLNDKQCRILKKSENSIELG